MFSRIWFWDRISDPDHILCSWLLQKSCFRKRFRIMIRNKLIWIYKTVSSGINRTRWYQWRCIDPDKTWSPNLLKSWRVRLQVGLGLELMPFNGCGLYFNTTYLGCYPSWAPARQLSRQRGLVLRPCCLVVTFVVTRFRVNNVVPMQLWMLCEPDHVLPDWSEAFCCKPFHSSCLPVA